MFFVVIDQFCFFFPKSVTFFFFFFILFLYFILAIGLIAFSIYSRWLSKKKKGIDKRSDSPWLSPYIGIMKWSVLTHLQIINQELKELVVFSKIIEENSFVFFLGQQVIWNLMKLSSWLFKKLCFWVLTGAMLIQINELLN